MTWDLEHPSQGPVRQVGFPISFSRSKVELRRFAPVLGEHTRELLAEAGYAAADIAALEADGVVKSWPPVGGSGAGRGRLLVCYRLRARAQSSL